MNLAYADASALAKLALREPESNALRHAMSAVDTIMTSIVGRIEFERVVRRTDGPDVQRLIDDVLDGLHIVPLNVAIAAVAASIPPYTVRSLDAIHLATMIAAADSIGVAYCYDGRLAAAATERGITVRAPA